MRLTSGGCVKENYRLGAVLEKSDERRGLGKLADATEGLIDSSEVFYCENLFIVKIFF